MASAQKRIQDLVYKGMVLDEKGAWIPLAEKLRKEKVFLRHLEQGEILADGVWCKLSAVPDLTNDLDETRDVRHPAIFPPAPKAPVIQDAAHLQTPEETVSFSTETFRDMALPTGRPSEQFQPEIDYAPETKIISIVKPPEPPFQPPSDRTIIPDGTSDQMVSEETRAYYIPSGQFSTPASPKNSGIPEPEFKETFLYNINILKSTDGGQVAPEVRPVRPPAPKPPAVSHSETSDDDVHLLRKRKPPFWLILLIAAGAISLLVVLWMLLP